MDTEEHIPFPYDPYPQQRQLMDAIFETISKSKSGCFESPTGTGKSLSVICSALHWQRIEENRVKSKFKEDINNLNKKDNANSSDDWLADMISSSNVNDRVKEKDRRQKELSLKNHDSMVSRATELAHVDNGKVRSMESRRRFASSGGYRGDSGTSGEKPVEELNQAANPENDINSTYDDEFALPYYDSDETTKSGKKTSII